MNEKQTAGEWVFCNYVETKQGRIPTEIWSGGVGKGKLIATLNYDPKDPELSNEKVLANIKLMAASKELLECCVEFVRKVDVGEARSTRSYNQMKAAIKKATE